MLRAKVAAPCFLIGIGLFHVLGVMSYVVRNGRLSMVPIYDDVVYLIDGLSRLAVLDRAGIAGWLADFYIHPAHSPLLSLTAVLGFVLSSGATWGPYLLNGAWVLFVLLLGLVALRQSSLWIRVGILVAALAAPMFGSVLAEFRPDPVWGLLVGFAMIVSASTDVVRARPTRLFAVGLLFAIAVISKPSAAPASAVVLAIGFTTQLGLSLAAQRAWSTKLFFRRVAFVALGAACLLVPFLIANGTAMLSYIREVMGAGSMWKIHMSAWGSITYYLNRDVATLMLGWVWYWAAPIFALCLAVLVRAKHRQMLPAFAGTMAALLAAYLIVTVSENKSLMIGSILYGTIIAAVVWCMGQIAPRVFLRGRAVMVFGALVFATQWVPRAGTIQREDAPMVATDEANRAALPAVLAALRNSGGGSVLVTVPGPAYGGTLDFLARQQGVVRTFVAGYTWDRWEQFTQGVASADVIVLSEAGMRGQSLGYDFPSVRFQKQLLEMLRASPEFKGRPVYTDSEQRSVWLFVRSRL